MDVIKTAVPDIHYFAATKEYLGTVNWLTDRWQFSDGFCSPPGDGGGGSDSSEVVFKDFGGGLDDLCVVAAIVVGSEHSGGVNSRDAIGDQSPTGPSYQTNLDDNKTWLKNVLNFYHIPKNADGRNYNSGRFPFQIVGRTYKV